MSRDKDVLLGHAADNDGIDEYDNPLPDWWLGLFFVTFVASVVYAVDYHFVSNRSQEARYEAEMLAAAERWPEQDAPSELSFDDATLAAGKQVYAQTCLACHGADMTGGIGPNLVDAEWIHGGEAEQVVKTISEGVAAKGMPAWGPVLGPEKVSQVAAWILSSGGQTAAR